MVIGHLDEDSVTGTHVQKGDAQLRRARRQVLPAHTDQHQHSAQPGARQAPAPAWPAEDSPKESIVAHQHRH